MPKLFSIGWGTEPMRRLLTIALAASVAALTPTAAIAHHQHEPSPNTAEVVLGAAVIGGLLYWGSQSRNHYYGHYEHHGRRRRHDRIREVGSYRSHGNRYRICRHEGRAFYC